MSVKVIAFINPMSRSRTVIHTEAKPIAEIIGELNSGLPLSHARVCRNGEIIKDFATNARDGDIIWIKFVPYGSAENTGAGMKVGGWLLAIAGVVIAAVAGWTGFGATIGVALIGTGLGMALGGTVLLNMNIP